MGERPWGGGRAPMERWARAHGPMGAEIIGDKNGNDGFAIVSSGRKVVKFGRILIKSLYRSQNSSIFASELQIIAPSS